MVLLNITRTPLISNGQAASLSITAEEEAFGVRTLLNPVRNFFGRQGKATINP